MPNFNSINPFPNAAGAAADVAPGGAAGKCRGVILTNTNGASGLAAGLIGWKNDGSTFETRVFIEPTTTEIFPINVWGVSFASGITGGVLS